MPLGASKPPAGRKRKPAHTLGAYDGQGTGRPADSPWGVRPSEAPLTAHSRACHAVLLGRACSRAYVLATQETLVAKPNYHHARKQKELARKARQQEKQQRRSTRPNATDENPTAGPAAPSGAGGPVPGSGT
jgi:hypothetical protein